MRLFLRSVFVLVLLLGCRSLFAEENIPVYLNIILDASGSMNEKLGDTNRMEIARRAAYTLIDQLPDNPQLHVGLRVYGNRSDKVLHDCTDTHLEIPIARQNRDQFRTILDGLQPRGYSPIAFTLSQAVADYPAAERSIRIAMLITDGVESCGMDPCAEAKALSRLDSPIFVHVIGFRLGTGEKKSLSCIAHNTGGSWYDATDEDSLARAMREALDVSLYGGYIFIDYPRHVDHCRLYEETTGSLSKEILTRTWVNILPGKYYLEIPVEPPLVQNGIVVRPGQWEKISPTGIGYIRVKTDNYLPDCRLIDAEGKTIRRFYSNTQIEVPEGIYRLEIPGTPPVTRENVKISNHRETTVELQPNGYLYLASQTILNGCRLVDETTGEPVLTFYSRVTIEVPPGTYRIEIPGDPPIIKPSIIIRSGHKTIVELN